MLLTQKKPGPDSSEINEAIRLFSGLANLDFEPGYNNHVYFQYLSNSKDDIALLDAHYSEEIFDKYIIWDNNIISYKIDESPAVITFIEVEYQKRLSARYFIVKFCSLIASTTLVIKETDFDAVATSQNLNPEEAENLKFDQERSIPDTIALKCFYM
ncbi:1493_t:CDS:2 [Racocetra persica]|uniref:1493_t:CDS:1 n=1 Tax=Racocetra persica TaxID=160502 RepID=A0ACA9KWH6_9GLOM|nr:1493_t:CDS:2 [Racocetra persica]